MTAIEHTRVAIYTRVSTSMQVDKDSLPMQKSDLEAYARLILHAEETEIFTDAGYSGKNTARPDFQRMMADVRSGRFSHVLVWKIDRISRNLLDFAAMYAELKSLGVVFVSKSEQFDTSSAMGEAMLKIILVFAELERNMTSERVTATMVSRAASGLWNGGKVPYGYDYDYQSKVFVVNPVEGPVVQKMYDLYLSTRSLVKTSVSLNTAGYRTRTGAEFSAVACGKILRSPFYVGDYLYNVRREGGNRFEKKKESEWVVVKDHHPAVIDRHTHEVVSSTLTGQRRTLLTQGMYAEGTRNVHVFGGLLCCGECGRKMASRTGNVKRDGWLYSKSMCPMVRVRKCSSKTVSDIIVGEFVINLIARILRFKKDPPPDIAVLRTALTAGATFEQVSEIGEGGLADLFDALHAPGSDVFSAKRHTSKPAQRSEYSRLYLEKQKLERAVDRLKHLYLLSESGMSDTEYLTRKAELDASMAELDSRLLELGVDSAMRFADDDQFIAVASRFILQKKISGRAYVNYKTLAMSVDPAELQAFFRSVIDRITITSGKVADIMFRNGIELTFRYKEKTPAG